MIAHRPPLEAVIFDIDGTLIDSVDQHAQAWVEAFRAYGHDFPFSEVRRQIGKGGDQLMPAFLPKGEVDRIGKQIEAFRTNLFKTRFLDGLSPFPRVRDLLQRLIADGRRIALASSAKEDEVERYKKIAGIADLLDAETSSDDADRSKPHPDIFDATLQRLGQPDRQRVMVVGDTPYDAQAAAKAGLATIGVRCGGWTEKELQDAGCVAVFADPSDLLARYHLSPLAL